MTTTPKISPAQVFADRLVRDHPGATSGELLATVAPERRAELATHLRYVAPAPREDRRLKRKRDRAVSPLVADLRRRLAERATKPRSRPTAHVDTGAGADHPSDPKENGA